MTKKGCYEEEDASLKLGMCVAAWQNRVAALRLTEKLVHTPLPGLIVFRHEWWLYWAVNQETAVGPIGFPISIDCTRTVTDCYRLLAAVRYFVGYVHTGGFSATVEGAGYGSWGRSGGVGSRIFVARDAL